MEHDEEIIKEEELTDQDEQDVDAPADASEDVAEANQTTQKAEVSENAPSKIESEAMPKKRVKGNGILLTIFAVAVIVLIGGLASYYYYTFQRQGMASEEVLTNVWDETMLASVQLANKFEPIQAFADLDEVGNNSFEAYVNDANRTIRDGIFDIGSQTGMDIGTSTFASKLNSFLDDYSQMLAELKRIIARVEDIDSTASLDRLIEYSDDMDDSYQDLILVGGNYIKANLPSAVFDMPEDILAMLEDQIEEEGTHDEQEKAIRQAAEQSASKFVQAWQNRDADGMTAYMTPGAAGEFNPGILEDSSDITSFRILSTTLSSDGSEVAISSQIDKETPDGSESTESWSFTLLQGRSVWLIDSWSQS